MYNKNRNKVYYGIKILLISFLVILVLPNSANAIKELTEGSIEITGFTDPSDEYGWCAEEDSNGNKLDNVYCLEHGKNFGDITKNKTTISYDAAKGLEGTEMKASCMGTPRQHSLIGAVTNPVLNPINYISLDRHIDMAYLLTEPNIGHRDKQRAIWKADPETWEDKVPLETPHTTRLGRESPDFSEFYSNVQSNGGMIKDDKTDLKNVKVISNYQDQTLTLGPYNIEYIDGGGWRSKLWWYIRNVFQRIQFKK